MVASDTRRLVPKSIAIDGSLARDSSNVFLKPSSPASLNLRKENHA
jgi:hypothetical protein